MKIIGITGGVGSGKSAILDYLEERYKAYICKADEVAMKLQEKDRPCFQEIVSHFGTGILSGDGEIDRGKLAGIVFSEEAQLKQLNQIVHPAVKREILLRIEEEKKKKTQYFVLEAALLLEENYQAVCDEMWYIYTRTDVRRTRLKAARGYSDQKIDDIIASQMSEEAFRNGCGCVIDNSGAFEKTSIQIDRIMEN
ncbi:MAG: dephospho-CoA kinase [Hespellia sp.]|nr:dephospho-CoA kinase [Hespellia sp.]